jgi:protein TonB
VDVGKGIVEPVPDDVLKGTEPELSDGGDGGEGEPLEGGIPGPVTDDGSIYVAPPAPTSAEAFTPFDTEPVLLSIDPPVYPAIVRDAGIDGQVMVRVFVALNGHVKDAYVVDGSPALRDAALTSARTAFFKPALAGTHPVEVWVVIPITFELRERY